MPNGASAAYRAVTYANSGATVAASRSRTAKLFAPPELWQGQVSRRRTRSGTSPNRGAERRGVMTLAGQDASTHHARAATLAHHGHLRRDHLSLEGRCELLRLGKPEPEVGQAGLFIALEACDLHLRRQARLQFCNQLHSPNHLRHRLTPPPVSPKSTQAGTNPTGLHALGRIWLSNASASTRSGRSRSR